MVILAIHVFIFQVHGQDFLIDWCGVIDVFDVVFWRVFRCFRCGSWLRLQLLENFYFYGTLVPVFIRQLTFCESAAVINHKFQGYADTSQYSEAVPERCSANMRRIYWRTSMYMCGFHKFEWRVWVFSKFAAYLQDTILPFCQKTSGGLFLNILFIDFTANF